MCPTCSSGSVLAPPMSLSSTSTPRDLSLGVLVAPSTQTTGTPAAPTATATKGVLMGQVRPRPRPPWDVAISCLLSSPSLHAPSLLSRVFACQYEPVGSLVPSGGSKSRWAQSRRSPSRRPAPSFASFRCENHDVPFLAVVVGVLTRLAGPNSAIEVTMGARHSRTRPLPGRWAPSAAMLQPGAGLRWMPKALSACCASRPVGRRRCQAWAEHAMLCSGK